MTALRYCDAGGLLVYPAGRLPTDPCEYHSEGVSGSCGCTAMRCKRCCEVARVGPPGRGLAPDSVVRPADLFLAARWDDLTVTKSYVRLYTCRCDLWECLSDAEGIDHKREFANDPHMDWACAGHPVPELPVRLGELEVGAHTDWAALVDKILLGACPRALELVNCTEGPALWLSWLYAYLRGLPHADALSAALAERVSDPDWLVRGRVLHFFERFPLATGFQRLALVAEWSPQLLATACPIPEWYKPLILFDAILARLQTTPRRLDADTARALQVVRHAMLAPPIAGDGVDIVVKVLDTFSGDLWDEEARLWLADNAVAVDTAGPGRWRAILDRLADGYMIRKFGYLIVIAGSALIQQRRITGTDFAAWLEGARMRGVWVDDVWVLPLQALFEDEAALAGED